MGAPKLAAVLILLLAVVSGGIFWWQRSIHSSGVNTLRLIEEARREVLNSPDDIYVPKEVAAEESLAKYHGLVFTQHQKKAGAGAGFAMA